MKMKILGSLGVLLAASFASLAQAGVINFDDLGLADDDLIPANYADHGLDGNGDNHVGVAYLGAGNNTNVLGFWTTGYGNLSNVAFTTSPDTTARINFSADPGWLINSIEFDLAGYPGADLLADVRIGLGGTVQTNNGALILGATSPFHSHFTLSGAGASSAFIQWGTDWNVGIDNIVFNVTSDNSVPEPGTLALLGLGLAGLGLTRRRAA